jgi:ATP-binding cassette subfamily B protein
MSTLENPPVGAIDRRALLADLPLLQRLSGETRALVLESFVPVSFAFGETIFSAGDRPDGFYVMASGIARVIRSDDQGDEISLNVLQPGDAFGETALVTRQPRSATVRASSDVTVLRLDASIFDALGRVHPEIAEAFGTQARARRLADLLRVHSAFSKLPPSALNTMLTGMGTITLAPGEVVAREGEPAASMYIVESGKLAASVQSDGSSDPVRYLRAGDFFGEVSLHTRSPRTATVRAVTAARVLELPAATFSELVERHPEFRSRIEERIAIYQRAPAAAVPLDFAEEILPADATEAAVVEEEPEPLGPEHEEGVHFSELDGQQAAAHAPAPSPRWLRRERFPHVRQIDEMDCGAACVAMVCRAFGRAVSVAHIRHAVGTSVDGTSLRGIQRGGESVGLRVRAVKASKDRLEDLSLPAIIHWDAIHWVVLYAVENGHARIADPARGLRRVKRQELDERWSGFAALPSPTPQLAEAPLQRASARWILPFIRPYARVLIAAFLLAILASGLQMLLPLFTKRIVDNVLTKRDYGMLHVLALEMVGLLLIALAAGMVQRRLMSRAAVQIDGATLDFVSGKMLRLPLAYFSARRTGDIERRLTGMRQIRALIVQQGMTALTSAIQLIVALVLLINFSIPMALLFLATAPAYVLLMRFSARRMRPIFEGMEEAYGRYASKQIDGIKGIATIKSLGAEPGLRRSLLREFRLLADRLFRADFSMMVYTGVVSITTFLISTLFLWFGALQVLNGNLTIGELLAVNTLVLMANAPLSLLLGLWDQWQMSAVLLGRLQDIFDQAPEQGDDHSQLRPVKTLEGRVTLRHVGFHYPTAPTAPILSDISIDVQPGTTVALVGRSGSGKSTLAKCLAGLLDITSGSIAYDGIDMRELEWADLRRRIGFVLQEPYIFDDTIAANIAYGEEEPDLERVRWAAEVADARDFIERLPLGYGTRIGESGLKLSGGQAQRVSIARALYWQPSVVILDEATSALDSESERAVKKNMDRLLAGRTAFVIAHRLSTIRDADLILVLERGHLAEHGTHEELMAREGLYWYLQSQQLET